MKNLNDLKSIIYSFLCILITVLVNVGLISMGMWPIAILSSALGAIYPIVELLDKGGIIKSQEKKKIEKDIDRINKNLCDESQSLCKNNCIIKYNKELRYEEDRKRINILFQENPNENLLYKQEKGPTLVKRKK